MEIVQLFLSIGESYSSRVLRLCSSESQIVLNARQYCRIDVRAHIHAGWQDDATRFCQSCQNLFTLVHSFLTLLLLGQTLF